MESKAWGKNTFIIQESEEGKRVVNFLFCLLQFILTTFDILT